MQIFVLKKKIYVFVKKDIHLETGNENRFPKISSEVKFWDYAGDAGG
jgi:hypothetical protein